VLAAGAPAAEAAGSATAAASAETMTTARILPASMVPYTGEFALCHWFWNLSGIGWSAFRR
jgi:hypothetical protein